MKKGGSLTIEVRLTAIEYDVIFENELDRERFEVAIKHSVEAARHGIRDEIRKQIRHGIQAKLFTEVEEASHLRLRMTSKVDTPEAVAMGEIERDARPRLDYEVD